MSELLHIDGSQGEGGGQVLRTALGLSLVTGRPFQIDAIRARRRKPGLMRQHLTAVQAAGDVGRARLRGAELGSTSLRFEPGEVRAGEYEFRIGTAGSTSLVLQAVLPAMLVSDQDWFVRIHGGTHNRMAPTAPFLAHSFVPMLDRMGARVSVHLERAGFYPAGGGILSCQKRAGGDLRPLDILERGKLLEKEAGALVAQLPRSIARREIAVITKGLAWQKNRTIIEEIEDSQGPGNTCWIRLAYEHSTAWFTGFGEQRKSAERVAHSCLDEAKDFLAHDAPIEKHLCDQLLLPLALSGGGSFRTTAPTAHSLTNAEVIQAFLPIDIRFEKEPGRAWLVTLATS